MVELVTFGESMLRYSPPAGERLETTDSLDVRVGGAESNVAVVAARLGIDATWLSKVHASPLGRQVTGELRRHGVEPAVVWTPNGRQGTYYVEPAGEPRGTAVVYDRDDAAVTTATADELPTERVERADWFYTSGITPALSRTLSTTTSELLDAAVAAGTTTAFDLNYRSKLWSPEDARRTAESLLTAVDVFVVAERDARTVMGEDREASQLATHFVSEYDLDTCVVTRGDLGATALHDGKMYEQGVYDAETVDPIGSGDAFVGGLLTRLAEGAGVGDALAFAAATAALKRTMAGDMGVVTRGEVQRVVDDERVALDR